MSVIAKFKVSRVAPSNNANEYFAIYLEAVTSGSDENKEFFKWTPNGQINLGTVNPKAAEQFKEGEEIYVHFTPASQVQNEVFVREAPTSPISEITN